MKDYLNLSPLVVEYIGYLAMVLVALSIMMKDIKWLRILNMAGAIIFVVYGFLIESPPVYILNLILTVLNAYHLIKMKSVKTN